MNIAVLGAGISGLSVARILKDNGHFVTVFEKNSSIGGLTRTRITNGYTYDCHGGHVFNSKHSEVTDWVFSLIPKDKWQFSVRNSKILFDGRYVSYPFELSLCELEPDLAVDCVYDFVMSQQGPEPDNFKDWLYWNFGRSIADSYMIPYNEKIWNYPLSDMEVKWVQGKMPLPDKKEIIRSMLLKDPSERKMPHSTYFYPLDGGIQTLVNAISEGVNVKCSYSIENITKTDGKWSINGEGEYDRIISTIPLNCLPSIIELPENVKSSIADLKYNSLTTVLFDCAKTDLSWLYIPSHNFRSHRIVYQGALSPNTVPVNSQCSGALELIGDRFDVDEKLLKAGNILPDELGFDNIIDYEFTEYAYVIHDKKYRESTELVKGYFEQTADFSLLGRWGSWNYKNMDLCILDAMNLAREIGKAE